MITIKRRLRYQRTAGAVVRGTSRKIPFPGRVADVVATVPRGVPVHKLKRRSDVKRGRLPVHVEPDIVPVTRRRPRVLLEVRVQMRRQIPNQARQSGPRADFPGAYKPRTGRLDVRD